MHDFPGQKHLPHFYVPVSYTHLIEGLNLQAAGVGVDAHGAIIVNDQLRTTVPHIWACLLYTSLTIAFPPDTYGDRVAAGGKAIVKIGSDTVSYTHLW